MIPRTLVHKQETNSTKRKLIAVPLTLSDTMPRQRKVWLGTALGGALFVAVGVNGLRLARIADLQHTGVFFKLAWMSPLQAYIASALCLAFGLSLIVASFMETRQK